MIDPQPTIYYFWFRCAQNCSVWLEADSVDGDMAHWPRVCPHDGTALVGV